MAFNLCTCIGIWINVHVCIIRYVNELFSFSFLTVSLLLLLLLPIYLKSDNVVCAAQTIDWPLQLHICTIYYYYMCGAFHTELYRASTKQHIVIKTRIQCNGIYVYVLFANVRSVSNLYNFHFTFHISAASTHVAAWCIFIHPFSTYVVCMCGGRLIITWNENKMKKKNFVKTFEKRMDGARYYELMHAYTWKQNNKKEE